MGESRGAYRILVGKSEGKRPLGKPTRMWEDNNNNTMDLQEVRCGSVDWNDVVQDRWRAVVNAVMNLWVT
jgi:hypothetical protein